MKMRMLGLCLLGIVGTTAFRYPNSGATPAMSAPAHFSVKVTHSGEGWTAHCATGCAWKDVTFTCGNCEVQLDETGISLASRAEAQAKGFAFVLSASPTGWNALGVRGVKWVRTTVVCVNPSSCTGVLNESGVRMN